MKLFRKKKEENTPAIVDPTTIEPQNADEYVKRAYAFHARGQYDKADQDLRQAISMDAHSSEAYYALGLNLKSMGRKEEAIQAFQQSLDYISQLEKEDTTRAHMLSRLIKGHINQLTKGEWDLRSEFWDYEG